MNDDARLSLPNLEARGRAGRARRGCALTLRQATGYMLNVRPAGRRGTATRARRSVVGRRVLARACDTE